MLFTAYAVSRHTYCDNKCKQEKDIIVISCTSNVIFKVNINYFQGGSENKESSSESESSSDDDQQWTKEVKHQHHLLRQEERERMKEEEEKEVSVPRFFELKEGEEFKGLQRNMKKRPNK